MAGGKNISMDMVMDVSLEANMRLRSLLDKQLDTKMERIELVEFVRGESAIPSGGPAGIASLAEFKAYEAQEQEVAAGRRDAGGEASTSGAGLGSGQGRTRKKRRMVAAQADVTFRESKSTGARRPEALTQLKTSDGETSKLGRHAAEVEASLLRETVSVHGISHLTKTGGTMPARQAPAHEVMDILQGVTPQDRVRQLAEAEASHKRSIMEVFSQPPRPLLDIESHVKEQLKAAELAGAEKDPDWGELVLVSKEEIAASRLSLAEIQNLPGGKFTEYSVGNPSRTLYVKNLAKTVEEADLRRLFGHFRRADADGSGVSLRVMKKGRMKGQAFVTFTDTDIARRALELVNGYVLMGKPMVIQYGREGSAIS